MASAFEYPEPVELPDCALVAIDLQLLPFVVGSIAKLDDRIFWQSDADYYRASEAINQFLECSMTACVGDLVASNDRLYRLLDAGLNGTIYTAAGDPIVITPTIGDVPPELAELPGLIARTAHLEEMIDALPGILDPGWFGYGGNKATIADVVRSLRIGDGEQATEAIDSLSEILAATGDITTIGGKVFDLLGAGVETLAEGGMMVVLAAGMVGNLAALGAVSNQLTNMALQLHRVTLALDGGTFLPPEDNILLALRGTTPASETRNVIDSIVAALALITSDDPAVLAKLEEIRVLLA